MSKVITWLTAAADAAATACAVWSVKTALGSTVSYNNTDVQGYDIACAPEMTFCKICGGIAAVEAACQQYSACMAFTFDPEGQCGYLKASADKRTPR